METIADAAVDGQVMFHQEYIWEDTARLQSELSDIEGSFCTLSSKNLSTD